MSEPVPAVAHPAATVVLLRDGEAGFEVLLVRRSAQLSFHGGAWVFPGGRLDAADYAVGTDDIIAAARCAAVREAREEAGLVLSPDALVLVDSINSDPAAMRYAPGWPVLRTGDAEDGTAHIARRRI
jgi:8-oxo-dGTP pyrophosphatase MutT (NUDIX family)